MKKLLLLFAVLMIIVVACNKDKFQTKPEITIKSYSTKELPPNAQLSVIFTFTDKEGDLADGKFIYYPKRLNVKPYIPSYPDSIVVPISTEVPKNTQKGDIELKLLWQDLHRSDIENDTIQIKFQVVDKANNRSDTLTSDKLVIHKN